MLTQDVNAVISNSLLGELKLWSVRPMLKKKSHKGKNLHTIKIQTNYAESFFGTLVSVTTCSTADSDSGVDGPFFVSSNWIYLLKPGKRNTFHIKHDFNFVLKIFHIKQFTARAWFTVAICEPNACAQWDFTILRNRTFTTIMTPKTTHLTVRT